MKNLIGKANKKEIKLYDDKYKQYEKRIRKKTKF